MVSQKYWATSMFTKEIPIEIRKIIGGVMEFKRNTFFKLGLISPGINPVLTATNQMKANVEPVKTRIIV
jgi:hypothetical protein